MPARARRRFLGGRPLALLALAGAALTAGCDSSGPVGPVSAGGRGATFAVVAAESFWGSIAAQLAGSRARVQSIIADPGTDPHSYQPTAADARRIANASLVIVNGVGYDSWARELVQASGKPERTLLDVGALVGAREGANPHRWYYPADVLRVVAGISAAYERADPRQAAYFAARRRSFETSSLRRYDELRAQIAARYAGVPVGYSESIFEGLGDDLRLRLMTPPSFARAIAEGTDVSAADKRAVDEQASRHRIDVWVLNSQNVTPDVRRVTQLAEASRIPVVRITETLDPAGATFEQWQEDQLEALLAALRVADRAK
jgi:zinc/manganese transport system substrate-binding protein